LLISAAVWFVCLSAVGCAGSKHPPRSDGEPPPLPGTHDMVRTREGGRGTLINLQTPPTSEKAAEAESAPATSDGDASGDAEPASD